MKLPRDANVWLPAYLRSRFRLAGRPRPKRLWVAITDHFEPYWKNTDDGLARQRVALWEREWPALAARHSDAYGRPPVYTFFYPEEEYRPPLLDALARIAATGTGDVEVHIHHDGEGEAHFLDHIGTFTEILHKTHGLLRRVDGRIRFGFIHGNWCLDNSGPGGRDCGLNNELTLLLRLGCYADFTMPCGPSPMQARQMNEIYWAIDNPVAPKSYDTGIPVTPGCTPPKDGFLMIPGPFALRLENGRRPKIELGELAGQIPVHQARVDCWVRHAPQIGEDRFLKLFAHGTQERHSQVFFSGGLDRLFQELTSAARREQLELVYVSAWQMAQAVDALIANRHPLEAVLPGTAARTPPPSSRA